MLERLRQMPSDDVALEAGSRSLTRSELINAVLEERDWLGEAGGRRHALLADNGAGWVIADLALLESGRLVVPIPAHFTDAQIGHILGNAGIDRILTDQPDRIRQRVPEAVFVGQSPASRLSLFARPVTGHLPAVPEGTVKVTYTSGSTGTPKGVCLTRDTLMTVARSLATLSGSVGTDRHLCLLPLPTLLENIAGLYAPLLAGAACTVPAMADTGMGYAGIDAARLLATIRAARPASLILVPELLRLLVAAAERGWEVPWSLRFIAVGGARVPPDLLARAHAFGLPAYEGYGLTECTSVVTLNLPGASRPGSVGKPLPHTGIRIDADGEIHVHGALMAGYLGDGTPPPAEVATGDLGHFDPDGYLYLHGRRRNVFITSLGRNLSPEWIESELLVQPAIAQALVFGEGEPHPLALLVPAAPDVADSVLDDAVAAANRRLPAHAQVRAWIRVSGSFSFANGLLTANGRPRREAILTHYAQS